MLQTDPPHSEGMTTTARAKPYAAHTPIQVPLYGDEQVKSLLDCDWVFEKLLINTPTTWCARITIVSKQNGEPQSTVNLQHLNKVLERKTHSNISPFILASDIPAGTKKSGLEVWNRYSPTKGEI